MLVAPIRVVGFFPDSKAVLFNLQIRIQGYALTFQSVDDIHSCASLPLGVFCTSDCIMDDIFQKYLQYNTGFLIVINKFRGYVRHQPLLPRRWVAGLVIQCTLYHTTLSHVSLVNLFRHLPPVPLQMILTCFLDN